MSVTTGNPATAADEADVTLTLHMNDVRLKSGLGDYAGELLATFAIRISDKDNGAAPNGQGTTQDAPFSFASPCSTTADTSLGADCDVATSADAVIPGAVKEGKRSIWQLGRVEVYDGGPDGDADSQAGNTLFATQGIFIP